MTDYHEAVREWDCVAHMARFSWKLTTEQVADAADAAIHDLKAEVEELQNEAHLSDIAFDVQKAETENAVSALARMDVRAVRAEASLTFNQNMRRNFEEACDLLCERAEKAEAEVARLTWMLDEACELLWELILDIPTAEAMKDQLAARYEAERDDIGIYDAKDLRGRDEGGAP